MKMLAVEGLGVHLSALQMSTKIRPEKDINSARHDVAVRFSREDAETRATMKCKSTRLADNTERMSHTSRVKLVMIAKVFRMKLTMRTPRHRQLSRQQLQEHRRTALAHLSLGGSSIWDFRVATAEFGPS